MRRTGLDGAALDGGFADTGTAAAWLDDGDRPERGDRAGVHREERARFRFDVRRPQERVPAAGPDRRRRRKSAGRRPHQGRHAAMAYLHQHAGYTRVHNPLTGNKDLATAAGAGGDRLPARDVAVRRPAPAHPRHRAQPPAPRRRPAGSRSTRNRLHHEAKAAGIIYQATLRHELHAERGFEWQPVDPHTGMAEIAGVDTDSIKAWSQRSTRLREWARNNLVVVDGEPTAAQLAAAQKATRPAKPESLAWAELKEQWRADARGLTLDRDAHFAARAERRAHTSARTGPGAHRRDGGAHRQARVHARRHGRARSARSCPSTRPAIRAR